MALEGEQLEGAKIMLAMTATALGNLVEQLNHIGNRELETEYQKGLRDGGIIVADQMATIINEALND